MAVSQRVKDVGVLVSGGRGLHGPETEVGWMEVGFATEKPCLEEALNQQSMPRLCLDPKIFCSSDVGVDRSLTSSDRHVRSVCDQACALNDGFFR